MITILSHKSIVFIKGSVNQEISAIFNLIDLTFIRKENEELDFTHFTNKKFRRNRQKVG